MSDTVQIVLEVKCPSGVVAKFAKSDGGSLCLHMRNSSVLTKEDEAFLNDYLRKLRR